MSNLDNSMNAYSFWNIYHEFHQVEYNNLKTVLSPPDNNMLTVTPPILNVF